MLRQTYPSPLSVPKRIIVLKNTLISEYQLSLIHHHNPAEHSCCFTLACQRGISNCEFCNCDINFDTKTSPEIEQIIKDIMSLHITDIERNDPCINQKHLHYLSRLPAKNLDDAKALEPLCQKHQGDIEKYGQELFKNTKEKELAKLNTASAASASSRPQSLPSTFTTKSEAHSSQRSRRSSQEHYLPITYVQRENSGKVPTNDPKRFSDEMEVKLQDGMGSCSRR